MSRSIRKSRSVVILPLVSILASVQVFFSLHTDVSPRRAMDSTILNADAIIAAQSVMAPAIGLDAVNTSHNLAVVMTTIPSYRDSSDGVNTSLPKYESFSRVRLNTSKEETDKVKVSSVSPHIQIILLRAIGNPLPPRHDPNQAFDNLKFTLENEPDFPHLTK